jgi:hypothetical protein
MTELLSAAKQLEFTFPTYSFKGIKSIVIFYKIKSLFFTNTMPLRKRHRKTIGTGGFLPPDKMRKSTERREKNRR